MEARAARRFQAGWRLWALVPVVLLAVAPFRIPVELGDEEAFLLLPLYLVLASAVVALAYRMLRGAESRDVPYLLALPLASFVSFSAASYLWTWDERAGAIALAFFVFPFTAGLAVVARALVRALVVGPAHRLRLGGAGALGDAVTDVVDRVVTGHVLLLQEVGGVALALGEDRHQHVGAGHLLAARGLHMGDGAVDHALEACGRLGVVVRIEHEPRELVVEISGELVPQQVDVDVAGAHYRRGVAVIEQRQEQMLERRVFVTALVGVLQGAP